MSSELTTVNPYFLHDLIGPLSGRADDDDAVDKFSTLDPNNERDVRDVIRQMIVSYAKELSTRRRQRIRLAYQYYLSKPAVNFERVFESILPPFDPPTDPRLFFIWVWEECFPGDSYELTQLNDFVEKPDANETWQCDLQ